MAHIACICPPRADGETRHPDGDDVTLRERLDFRGATTATNEVALAKLDDPDIGGAEILAILTEQYLLNGIVGWTLVGPEGKPLPVTKPNIRERLLTNGEAASLVAEEADGLYSSQVLGPLVLKALASSPPTPKGKSTSASQRSPRQPRKPSKPSSTTTTRTDATGTTTGSPAGAFSFSQSSDTAA